MTANRRRIRAVAGVVGHRRGKGRGDRFPDAGLPIVERGPALASTLRRQKGFEQTPLRFAQVAATQSCLPPRGILESKPDSRVNRFVNSARRGNTSAENLCAM